MFKILLCNPSVGNLCLWLNHWSASEACHDPAFMSNYPVVSHRFLALSTQWMNSSRE